MTTTTMMMTIGIKWMSCECGVIFNSFTDGRNLAFIIIDFTFFTLSYAFSVHLAMRNLFGVRDHFPFHLSFLARCCAGHYSLSHTLILLAVTPFQSELSPPSIASASQVILRIRA